MKYNYERASWDPSYDAYELCFQCHEQSAVTSVHSQIRNSHSRKTSCNVCHDPHGVAGSPYLLNWDISVVTPNNDGDLYYVDLGPGSGECYMMCHNHDHTASSYN